MWAVYSICKLKEKYMILDLKLGPWNRLNLENRDSNWAFLENIFCRAITFLILFFVGWAFEDFEILSWNARIRALSLISGGLWGYPPVAPWSNRPERKSQQTCGLLINLELQQCQSWTCPCVKKSYGDDSEISRFENRVCVLKRY